MLQTIREHTQGWIAGIIISLIIISFALWGVHSYFVGGASNDSAVATVNGNDITKGQLSASYERLRRQAEARFGTTNPMANNEALLKSRALQNLINFEVLKEAAISQGFHVSDLQVDAFLQGMPEFQVDGQFSLERFQETLASSMLSVNEFLSLIKTSLLIDQPKLGIVFSSFALPEETNATVALINQERNISYISIPLAYFLAKPMTISAKQIDAYYQQHQKEFMTPEQVNVEYIQLTLDDAAKQIEPTEEELKKFYGENTSTFAEPMQWKLEDILVPVAETAAPNDIESATKTAEDIASAAKRGDDFTKLVNQYKQNMSGKNWMLISQVPIELQEVVTGLTKAGQVTGPIKTSKGLVIVKVIELKQPKPLAFTAVNEKVKSMVVKQRAEEKFAEAKEQLADLTYAQPDSLQSAAETLKLTIKTSELFSRDQPGSDIAQYQAVRTAAFSDEVKNLQNNSDVITLDNNSVIVLRIKSHQAASMLPLNAVMSDIESRLKQEVANDQLVKFANDMQAKLQAGADLKTLAVQYKLTITEVGTVGRYTQKIPPAILETAFQLANPVKVNKPKTYGLAKTQNGYAIVALTSVQDGKIADKKQAAIFAEQVQNSDGLLEYELYRQSLMQNAKIHVQNSG